MLRKARKVHRQTSGQMSAEPQRGKVNMEGPLDCCLFFHLASPWAPCERQRHHRHNMLAQSSARPLVIEASISIALAVVVMLVVWSARRTSLLLLLLLLLFL